MPWPRLPPGAGQKDVGTGTQKQLSEKAARQPAREYAREHIRRHFADALQLVLQGTNGHTYCGIEYTLLARRHRLGLCRGLLVWHSVEACTAWPKLAYDSNSTNHRAFVPHILDTIAERLAQMVPFLTNPCQCTAQIACFRRFGSLRFCNHNPATYVIVGIAVPISHPARLGLGKTSARTLLCSRRVQPCQGPVIFREGQNSHRIAIT